MQLPSPLRRTTGHRARHADPNRAPKDTPCVDCGKTEPGTNDDPVTLAECSICQVWRCSNCYVMHRGPDAFYQPQTRRAWWLRVIGHG